MTITFLGTGTSHGVPTLRCRCPVCTSSDPRNKRTRASLWIRRRGVSVLIDTATDFRTQALREDIDKVDLILQTHAHADHTHGLDDIRIYSRKGPIPLAGFGSTLRELEERFSYIFRETQRGGGKPQIHLVEVFPGKPAELAGFGFTPLAIRHGDLTIAGYRWENCAYLTDCSGIPESTYPLLKGLDLLILDALRYDPHSTHFSLDEALEAVKRIAPRQTYLTHMAHDFDHAALADQLPPSVQPAWDGLTLET